MDCFCILFLFGNLNIKQWLIFIPNSVCVVLGLVEKIIRDLQVLSWQPLLITVVYTLFLDSKNLVYCLANLFIFDNYKILLNDNYHVKKEFVTMSVSYYWFKLFLVCTDILWYAILDMHIPIHLLPILDIQWFCWSFFV